MMNCAQQLKLHVNYTDLKSCCESSNTSNKGNTARQIVTYFFKY